jgi:hypothetical protein
MEQRRYSGDLWPEGLADYLVQQYEGRRHTTAQKIGQGTSFIVQIGEDRRRQQHPAVTVGIVRPEEGGLLVSVSEQQWIDSETVGDVIGSGILSALIGPWGLLGLIEPAARMLRGEMMPEEIWTLVDTYVASMGGAWIETSQAPAAQPVGAAADGEVTRKLNDPRYQ